MSNHVHLIIETTKTTQLSKLMKRLDLLYYNHYKQKYGYAGHFWQGRFKSLLVDKDNYLLACGLYVERNPARARIVKDAKDYKHSSYKYYAYGEIDGLVDEDINYDSLGKSEKTRQKEYRRLMEEEDGGLDSNVFSRLYLGTEDFVKRMEKKFGLRNIRMRKGRPKKDEK